MILTVPELVAQAKTNVTCVNAKDAVNQLTDKCVVIDVREPAENAQKSIERAVNIPRGVLEMQIGKICNDENTAIYIHCASGGRACLAAEQLQRIGYKNVSAITCPADEVCNAFIKAIN